MSEKVILLWLQAPLQSWGFDSKFGRRETLDFPTKSGVLGLVLCAMGLGGEQQELLKRLSSRTMNVLSFIKESKMNGATHSVGVLKDFQTVGTAYDENDVWQQLLIPRTVEGKKPVGGGAKLIYRHYLQDAQFAVLMHVSDDEVQEIAQALTVPRWDIYLGRKCCAPEDLVFKGVFCNEYQAREFLKTIIQDKHLKQNLTVLDGNYPEMGEVFYLSDVPLAFGKTKRYGQRPVTVIRQQAAPFDHTLDNGSGEDASTV